MSEVIPKCFVKSSIRYQIYHFKLNVDGDIWSLIHISAIIKFNLNKLDIAEKYQLKPILFKKAPPWQVTLLTTHISMVEITAVSNIKMIFVEAAGKP